MEATTLLTVSVLIFFVAILYSSVGHGGASGYLAVLSFFVLTPAVMASTALALNVLVAGVGMVTFFRAGHFRLKLAWPFVALSIPAAFFGGLLQVPDKLYFLLLAPVLVVAAYRLAIVAKSAADATALRQPWVGASLAAGGGIGFLSGIVGVGGGIFLSPLIIFLRWADPKQTAAISAFFIVVNSLAGLGGRSFRGGLDFGEMLPLILAAFAGGLIGSHVGANEFSGLTIRRVLSLVLLVASFKLLHFWI